VKRPDARPYELDLLLNGTNDLIAVAERVLQRGGGTRTRTARGDRGNAFRGGLTIELTGATGSLASWLMTQVASRRVPAKIRRVEAVIFSRTSLESK
jgi:hypothetical protein